MYVAHAAIRAMKSAMNTLLIPPSPTVSALRLCAPSCRAWDHAGRRARRQWYSLPSIVVDRLVEAGFVTKEEGHRLFIVTRRALPDLLLAIRTDPKRGLIAQPARPSTVHRSPEYVALALTIQIRISRRLQKLAKEGDVDKFIAYLVEAAGELGSEDQKVVEAERRAHGGRLPEKREPNVSVRALQGGLPSLGKRH